MAPASVLLLQNGNYQIFDNNQQLEDFVSQNPLLKRPYYVIQGEILEPVVKVDFQPTTNSDLFPSAKSSEKKTTRRKRTSRSATPTETPPVLSDNAPDSLTIESVDDDHAFETQEITGDDDTTIEFNSILPD